MSDALNVQQALAAVMDELPAIGKDQSAAVVEGGYAYRGIEAIAKHLQPLLAKHGVIITPLSHLISQAPALAMKEGWTDTILDVEWRVYGPGGDSIEARTQGIGRDKSDKGAAKALTQARKNLLLSLFCIADKADDADGQSYEHDRAQEIPAEAEDLARSREALQEAISGLSDADKELVKLEVRNQRVPSLKKPGATRAQLDALVEFIAALKSRSEPFLVDSPTTSGRQGDGDGPDAGTAQGTAASPPPSQPFSPVVAEPVNDLRNLPPGARASARKNG